MGGQLGERLVAVGFLAMLVLQALLHSARVACPTPAAQGQPCCAPPSLHTHQPGQTRHRVAAPLHHPDRWEVESTSKAYAGLPVHQGDSVCYGKAEPQPTPTAPLRCVPGALVLHVAATQLLRCPMVLHSSSSHGALSGIVTARVLCYHDRKCRVVNVGARARPCTRMHGAPCWVRNQIMGAGARADP